MFSKEISSFRVESKLVTQVWNKGLSRSITSFKILVNSLRFLKSQICASIGIFFYIKSAASIQEWLLLKKYSFTSHFCCLYWKVTIIGVITICREDFAQFSMLNMHWISFWNEFLLSMAYQENSFCWVFLTRFFYFLKLC